MKKTHQAYELIHAQRELAKKINSIPKENKEKFALDLLALVELAHGENYHDYHI